MYSHPLPDLVHFQLIHIAYQSSFSSALETSQAAPNP